MTQSQPFSVGSAHLSLLPLRIQLCWFTHTHSAHTHTHTQCTLMTLHLTAASTPHLPIVWLWLVPVCPLLPQCCLPTSLPVPVPHCAFIISSLICCLHQATGSVRAEAVSYCLCIPAFPRVEHSASSLQDLVRYLLNKWNTLSYWSLTSWSFLSV